MSCTFYSFKGGLFGGDYWCDKKDCRVDNDTYRRYCRDYNYSNCPIFKKSDSSGCFITTVVCDILGNEDNHEILNNLRKFRDEVLQKDEKYYEILKDYDNIGPYLADYIANDRDSVTIANTVYNNMILPVNELILNKEYEMAVSKYQLMVMSLIEYYSLRELYDELKSNDYGYLEDEFVPMCAGHGKRKILVKPEV